MPTNIRILHAYDFIRATPEGHLDLESSKTALMEIASLSSGLAEYEILLDTRKAESKMSVVDLWYLAAELGRLSKPLSRKTAVLYPAEEFDQADFFVLCAQNRGLRVMAFSSFEDAIEWLSIGLEQPCQR